jgi:hypothetical protein
MSCAFTLFWTVLRSQQKCMDGEFEGLVLSKFPAQIPHVLPFCFLRCRSVSTFPLFLWP